MVYNVIKKLIFNDVVENSKIRERQTVEVSLLLLSQSHPVPLDKGKKNYWSFVYAA